MIPWIQVYSNLPMTSKIFDLADRTSGDSATPEVIAIGHMVKLWLWAVQNAVDGDLSKCNPRLIANAGGWTKDPDEFIDILKEIGWLDDDMKLHNWDRYAGLLIDREESKKQKTKERVSKFRAKRSEADNAEEAVTQGDVERNTSCNAPVTQCNAEDSVTCNAGVTPCNAGESVTRNAPVTLCNAPTIPNHTIPIPSSSDDDDGNACACAEQVPAPSAAVAYYANRINPTASERSIAELEAFERAMGTDVCKRAIDTALDERKTTWSYIRGILRAKQAQGVKCLADWDKLEEKRETGGQENVVKREYIKPPDLPGALYRP